MARSDRKGGELDAISGELRKIREALIGVQRAFRKVTSTSQGDAGSGAESPSEGSPRRSAHRGKARRRGPKPQSAAAKTPSPARSWAYSVHQFGESWRVLTAKDQVIDVFENRLEAVNAGRMLSMSQKPCGFLVQSNTGAVLLAASYGLSKRGYVGSDVTTLFAGSPCQECGAPLELLKEIYEPERPILLHDGRVFMRARFCCQGTSGHTWEPAVDRIYRPHSVEIRLVTSADRG